MTVITYGKSVTENAKTRRHARRRAAAIERDSICSIIDEVFGIEPEAVEVVARPVNRVARATSAPSLREKHESTAMCLPQVALFQAGHRKVRKDATHIIK